MFADCKLSSTLHLAFKHSSFTFNKYLLIRVNKFLNFLISIEYSSTITFCQTFKRLTPNEDEFFGVRFLILQTALQGFYHDSSLFTSSVTRINPGACDNRHCVRYIVHIGGTWEDKSIINFGLVWVQTPASCVPGECFIHCAMTLRLEVGWLHASSTHILEIV